jgi:hypothetical protein
MKIAMPEGQTGTINPGLLFRVLPTSFPTFHAFISAAGYGLSKSTGKCEGSAGAILRS